MAKFIDLVGVKNALDIMLNIDNASGIQVVNDTRLLFRYPGFEVNITFDRKNPKALEMMKSISEGNTDISAYTDSIKDMQIR
ncbi:MAG TPA: hypothetical protein PKV16_05000 [Caldisericia bacterium]|nr:hypothetical protein [Caldisericia bacterium]HPF48670.1 hypothetical protein [Caldisericia bacterium]HPI83670.1 hypothetical protein [Caldisericia bacterium]HPQ93125.1 hypothetical protein [Caldisericia bacterium]HRV75042.1 hypothetical protein [Caldisericia bacterium]